MMTSEFNAIDYTNELQATGVPKDQATVHANALTRVLADVAFSRDLVKLESNLRKEILACEERMILRIDLVRTDLGAKIEAVRTQLEARIDAVGARLTQVAAEIRAEIAVLRAEIGSVRNELILHRWILGIVLALGTANLALTVKLLMP